jgi:hypothetical protein
MLRVRLTNFRSFEDTSSISLRPITVLVGANSSGKSSCLRFFPLLRQSVEARSRSPLLWFGDYVDFGDFGRAVNRRGAAEEIGIELTLRLIPNERRLFGRRELRDVAATIQLALREHHERTYVSECTLTCFGDTCKISFDSAGRVHAFKANGKDILKISPNYVGLESAFVPIITYVSEASDARSDGIKRFRLRHYEQFTEPDLDYLRALVLARVTPTLLEGASRAVQVFARGISYVGPFRHNPERFYRQQDLSITQIDPQGKNLAMFLRALNPGELESLSAFVHQHLGMRLRLESESSHVTISLADSTGAAFNLIDMGYGFSQILPIIAQCWAAARAGRRKDLNLSMLAIEQPELHLHPFHQARLADMFVAVLDAVREQMAADDRPPSVPPHLRRNLPIILVETHSEVLLSRLGELVESGRLPREDVAVLLVQKDSVSGLSTIASSTFGSDGVLMDWPMGFFSPSS